MYMYPIAINIEAQEIRYQNEYNLGDGLLTLAILRKYVSEDQTFSVNDGVDEDDFSDNTILYVNGTRLETKGELSKRVAKEEAYMKRYNEFHATKPKA